MLGKILVEQKRAGGTNLIAEVELITHEESRRAAALRSVLHLPLPVPLQF
jgi:hypothetical protein